jgi:Domain of unknown function (DUF4136)
MHRRVFMTTVGLAMLGAVALAQDVTYDYDRAANFRGYRSYAWIRGTDIGDELNHKRIVQAVEAQLASKGLTRADANGEPDLFVAYHAAFDRNLQINTLGAGPGFRFGGSGTARVEEIVTGTLAVDIIDAKTRSIVWRGMAAKELEPDAKPEKREKNINRAAEKLFKNYPPTQKELP